MNKNNEYWLPRDAPESERLDRQHKLFEAALGYVLHPSITTTLLSTTDAGLRIADLGCGTGVFLQTLSKTLPLAQLVGFDISPDQFPPKSSLPINISLEVHDLTEEFPSNLHGTFDLVHARLVGQGFRTDQWQTALANVVSLLKPGGMIQWTEPDHVRDATIFVPGNRSPASSSLSKLDVKHSAPTLARLFDFTKRRERDLNWDRETLFARELRILMSTAPGMDVVREEVVPVDWNVDPNVRAASVQNSLGFFAAALYDFVDRGLTDDRAGVHSRRDAEVCMRGMRQETEDGKGFYRYFLHIVVGRKQA